MLPAKSGLIVYLWPGVWGRSCLVFNQVRHRKFQRCNWVGAMMTTMQCDYLGSCSATEKNKEQKKFFVGAFQQLQNTSQLCDRLTTPSSTLVHAPCKCSLQLFCDSQVIVTQMHHEISCLHVKAVFLIQTPRLRIVYSKSRSDLPVSSIHIVIILVQILWIL